MNIQLQLIAFARQIAVYSQHPNLLNGLQPQNVLEQKLARERDEFAEALEQKDIWHQLHEAADLLYYSAALSGVVDCMEGNADPYQRELQALALTLHLPMCKIEAAAVAKYTFRASAPGMKNEHYEIELIKQAIESRQSESSF